MSNQRYMMRGVSAAKEDVHNAIKNIDNGYLPAGILQDYPRHSGRRPEYCNIMHADGAGTKSSLAYAYWKETGDLSVWKGIAQDALIMNTDDLLCVGAVDNILVSSTIGRNKMLIPGEVISAIINGTDELLSEMRKMGIGIYATGGETADVGDLVRTIIVDSTVTCRMKRSDVIDNANIRPGDVIVGLSSCGQATYEEGIQRRYGEETDQRTPRRVCQVSGRKISRNLRQVRSGRVGLQRQLPADRPGGGCSGQCRQARPVPHPYIRPGGEEGAGRDACGYPRHGTLHRRCADQGAPLRW